MVFFCGFRETQRGGRGRNDLSSGGVDLADRPRVQLRERARARTAPGLVLCFHSMLGSGSVERRRGVGVAPGMLKWRLHEGRVVMVGGREVVV